ncbi:MAG: hypothetical protein R6T92_02870 [Desulfosalsimonadaceae bacterium]
MIKKVFFPSTFITQETAAAINRRLGRFVLYQPIMDQTPPVLGHLCETSAIELRHPVIGNEAYLLELCRAYSTWGSVHPKDALRLNRLAGEGFYNQDFAAEIRTEVLKQRNGVSSDSAPKADPMVNARMFLQLAQEFDLRESEIRQSLEKTDNASRQLFEELRGEGLSEGEYSGAGDAGATDDASAVMTEARLSAWALLGKNDSSPPDIFVTDSRAVMDALFERFPSMVQLEKTAAAGEPETAAQALSDGFRSIADNPWAGAKAGAQLFSYLDRPAEDGFFLEAFAVPDVSSEKMLESLADLPVREGLETSGPRHSFFCLVSRAGG